MEVETIKVSHFTAQEKYLEYREQLAISDDEETELLMRAHRAVYQGKAVISLHRTAQAIGVDAHGLPKLAIARATAQNVWYRRYRGSPFFLQPWFSTTGTFSHSRVSRSYYHNVILPRNLTWPETSGAPYVKALVPMIPPRYVPTHGGLHLYHILFEPVWKPTAPVDPFLVRHLGGDLYVIVAQWDLTEIERAVLESRLTDLP